jgi:hypothetical protein
MDEVQVKVQDATGTLPPMGREDIEKKIAELVQKESAGLAEKLPPEQKAKAEELLKKVQMVIGMFNMWMNAMIADVAATTVFSMESQYKLGEFLSYQAEYNQVLSNRVEAMGRQLSGLEKDHEDLRAILAELKKGLKK